MSLEGFALVAEIIASIAVVITLVYVIMQLRQNLDFMRASASSERVQRDFDLAQALIENREMAKVWAKGDSEFNELEHVDKIRLMFFERRAIVHWHNMFELYNKKLLPESDWVELNWLIKNLGQRQAIKETWQYFRGSFDYAFQQFMDGNLDN
jgi:hypothetical protein